MHPSILRAMAEYCPGLEELDLWMCRNVTVADLSEFILEAQNLSKLSVELKDWTANDYKTLFEIEYSNLIELYVAYNYCIHPLNAEKITTACLVSIIKNQPKLKYFALRSTDKPMMSNINQSKVRRVIEELGMECEYVHDI